MSVIKICSPCVLTKLQSNVKDAKQLHTTQNFRKTGHLLWTVLVILYMKGQSTLYTGPVRFFVVFFLLQTLKTEHEGA